MFYRLFAVIGLVLAAALAAGCSDSQQARAQVEQQNGKAHERLRTITVTSAETVSIKPDLVLIQAGVVSEDAQAQTALKRNSAAMAFILDELKKAGVAEKDLQTSNFNIAPRYRYIKNQAPEIQGYRVTNALSVRVRDIPKLGAILDKIVTLGANQINAIRFEVSDADKLKDEARSKAVARAKEKAELYAKAAGAELGAVQTISETVQYSRPRPFAMAEARSSSRGQAVPIAGGEQTLTVRVNTVWRIR